MRLGSAPNGCRGVVWARVTMLYGAGGLSRTGRMGGRGRAGSTCKADKAGSTVQAEQAGHV